MLTKLLQAAFESPNDDGLRLILADWLEEHGHPERAELLRLQIRVAKLSGNDPQRQQLKMRERQLLEDHWEEWLSDMLGAMAGIPWLVHVGERASRDPEVRRIHAWQEWPGPQDPGCAEYADFTQECFDGLTQKAGTLRDLATRTKERVERKVAEQAMRNSPLYSGSQDAWHGPTVCVWVVAWWAGVIAASWLFRREITEEEQRIWRWIVAGHWPCGFTYSDNRKLIVY
jgi:uncharacterized protein (TIGR02996 family)